MPSRFLPIAITVLFFLAVLPVPAYESHMEEVLKTPTVTYRKAFSIDAARELWDRVLDHPFLMGQIWTAYEFQPPYNVTMTDTVIRVSDSLGITGDIRQVGRSERERTFYGKGSFDHWAVPPFFTASAVVVFTYNTGLNGLSGEMTISMRGDNGISRLVMRLFSGILTRRIGHRVGSTLDNMKEITRDITRDPQKIRDALTGEALGEFDRVFPAEKDGSADDEEVLFDLQRRTSR